jgi:hypothetical protein
MASCEKLSCGRVAFSEIFDDLLDGVGVVEQQFEGTQK